MAPRPFVRSAVVTLFALLGLLGLAQPASAVPADKVAVFTSWTQTSSASYSSWNSARQDQGAWAAYGFSWSTDYCSTSPDNPLGFNFELSCYRHDFGYRNSKALGIFAGSKSRLDSAFYEDLKRKCATYNAFVRPACYSLAWTYYQAVHLFGSVVTTRADLDRAARLLPAGAVVG
jgi:Prokaryotic phospholipase A2